jgi:hypothetical protein
VTAILLIVIVLFIGSTGLVWIVIPLLRRIPWANEKSDMTIDVDLERSIQMLKDIQADHDRGSLSFADFNRVNRDVRREAAEILRSREQQRLAMNDQIEALVTGTQPAAAYDARNASTKPAAIAWVVPSVVFAVLLAALVIVITISARHSATEQTAIGIVGASTITGMTIDDNDPDTLVVTHSLGVSASHDSGQTWTSTTAPGPTLGATSNSGLLFILTPDGPWSSTDKGSTWSPTSTIPPFTHISSGQRSGQITGVLSDGVIRSSSDQGRTWSTSQAQAPPGTTAIAVIDFDTPFLLAATSTEGLLANFGDDVWRSANGFVNGALPTVVAYSVVYAAATEDIFTASSGDRFEGAVFVATDAGLFKSTDGLQSWQLLSLKANVRALGNSLLQARTIFAIAADGTVYRSSDSGTTWR